MSKADEIFWRQFGLILGALTVFGILMFILARIIAGAAFETQVNNPKAVLERIAPVGSVRVGDPNATVAVAKPAAAAAAAETTAAAGGEGETVYGGACIACHASGAAGAPKLDDQAAWAPRIETGMDAMVARVVNGKGAMPPRSGFPHLSDDELKAGIRYLLAIANLTAE